jgi:hypothetical protein
MRISLLLFRLDLSALYNHPSIITLRELDKLPSIR